MVFGAGEESQDPHSAHGLTEHGGNGSDPHAQTQNPKMRMGSRMMLMTAPMTVVSILVLAKPWVVMKGFMPSTSSTNTEPRM